MLDIVHYFFESDSLNTEEEHDAKQKLRGVVYNQLYDRPYTWGADASGSGHEFGSQETASGRAYMNDAFGSQDVGNPPEFTHKPYVPPTPMDAGSAKPFGDLLDAPLG